MSQRVFYHSITGEPMDPNDFSQDSEEDSDSSWQLGPIDQYINREDIPPSEQRFMHLWNSYMNSQPKPQLDSEMKDLCLSFYHSDRSISSEYLSHYRQHLIVLLKKNILTLDDLLYITLSLS